MTDNLAAEARRLRTVEGLSVGQIRDRLGIGKDRLYELLRGVPAPEWTRRPNAKDELRARAVRLRETGWSVTDIATELGVAKSTAYQWVKHLPLDPDSDRARQRHAQRRPCSVRQRLTSGARRRRIRRPRCDSVRRCGPVTSSANCCWWARSSTGARGRRTKPGDRKQYELAFVNSDPRLVELFLRFVEATGMARGELRYRLSIHETADVAGGRPVVGRAAGACRRSRSGRPQIKRHKPQTNRLQHGCRLPRLSGRPRAAGSEICTVWIEGVIAGSVAGVAPAGFTRAGGTG